MSLVPITSVVPPDGFHFIDRSTGVPVKIIGDNQDDVASKVLIHRLANGKAPGNPAQELIDYLCGTWPHFCRETNPAFIKPNPNASQPSLATRCATWIADFFVVSRGDPGVGANETQRRADICAGCRENKEIVGCGSCVSNVNRLFFVWRRDRALPREKELQACDITGQHNGCASLAAVLPPLDEETTSKLPAHCWRKSAQPINSVNQ